MALGLAPNGKSALDWIPREPEIFYGSICIVGLFGGSIEIPLVSLPTRAITITGVYVGSLPEFRELLALACAGRVKPMPMECRPLGAAQQSLDDLRAGRVNGRIVLIP